MALLTTLPEGKARLVPGRTVTPTIAGDKLLRRWEYVDATYSDTLVTALKAIATVVDPEADGQTYTGTYAVGSVTAQAQGDRSVTITQELTLINAITSTIGTLQALSPLKEYDNEILQAFSIQDGEADRISWTYKNIDPTDRAIAMAYSDANLETTLGANAGEYLARKFTVEEDGTGTFVIITEGHAWDSTWDNAVKMQESNVGGYRLAENNEATGIPESGRDAAFTAAQAASDTSTRSVAMTQLIEKANGERIINQIEKWVSVLTTDASAVIIKVGENVGNRDAMLGRVWWRRTLSAKAILTTPTTGKAVIDYTYNSVTYTHTEVRVEDNGDGSYNVFQMLSVPNEPDKSWGSPFRTEEEIEQSHDEVVLWSDPALPAASVLTAYHRTVWRKVFDSYGSRTTPVGVGSGALGYAEFGTGGTPGASTAFGSDSPKNGGKTTHAGRVKYIGSSGSKDYWEAINVQLAV